MRVYNCIVNAGNYFKKTKPKNNYYNLKNIHIVFCHSGRGTLWVAESRNATTARTLDSGFRQNDILCYFIYFFLGKIKNIYNWQNSECIKN